MPLKKPIIESGLMVMALIWEAASAFLVIELNSLPAYQLKSFFGVVYVSLRLCRALSGALAKIL
jgi:hypothetical protein